MSVAKVEKSVEEYAKTLRKHEEAIKAMRKKAKDVYRRLYPSIRMEVANTVTEFLGLGEDSTTVEDEEEEFNLPRIEDYSPELKRQMMVGQVEDEIKRVRKLSAEDMVDVFLLHSDKRLSGRKIGEKFGVSEKTVRKTVRKVREWTKSKS